MLPLKFCFQVEKVLKSVIDDCYPYEWHEDHITRDILKGLRKSFRDVTLFGYRYQLNINWEVYKYTGTPEHLYGDVAVLVKIRFRNGDLSEGVGFLEAKKRSIDSNRFDSLKNTQLKDIMSNAPQAFLLLYDYENITTFINSICYLNDFDDYGEKYLQGFDKHGHFPRFSSETYCVVAPANLITSTSPKTTSLYNRSLPLSYQLCYRYLFGFDLEYDSTAIDIAKGYPQQRRYPRYVMVIRVGQNVPPPELDEPLNSEVLQILEE